MNAIVAPRRVPDMMTRLFGFQVRPIRSAEGPLRFATRPDAARAFRLCRRNWNEARVMPAHSIHLSAMVGRYRFSATMK